MGNSGDLTELLDQAGRGDGLAQERLYTLLHEELRQMAQAQMGRERQGHTLQPTVLVNDIFMRLVAAGKQSWENRRHFYAAAAEAMRRILIDHARARDAKKRRAPGGRESLENVAERSASGELDFEELDRAMVDLAREHPRQAEVVRYKFLVGLTIEQIAEALGVSERTVQTDWKYARAWLLLRLGQGDGPAEP